MKVISLGHACQVKFQINTFFRNEETNFFDWLITDFTSVLYVLKNINSQQLITASKFTDQEVFKPGKSWFPEYHKIECLDFKMISIHDFPSSKPYTEYLDTFVTKYNRRLTRLKNHIKSNENVHFIHCLDHQFTSFYQPTLEDIDNFKRYLSNINPNHNCYLHIVIPPKLIHLNLNYIIQEKVHVYYLKVTQQGDFDWKNCNYNWQVVFDNINIIG